MFPEEEHVEEVELTDEPVQHEVGHDKKALKGENILILGGYKTKQAKEEEGYTLLAHDTRTMDPAFYEHLHKADLVVVLTGFISHRAMWEEKEFAILEQNPIYFSTFTNVQRY